MESYTTPSGQVVLAERIRDQNHKNELLLFVSRRVGKRDSLCCRTLKKSYLETTFGKFIRYVKVEGFPGDYLILDERVWLAFFISETQFQKTFSKGGTDG